jgi:transcriptional regulator with XRE-family HTH domain
MAKQPDMDRRGRDDPAVAVGRQIRSVRQQKALSMQALAEAAGISRAWLGEIERGAASPSVDIVRRLADTLSVSIGSLLDGSATQAGQEMEGEAPIQEVHLIRKDRRLVVRFPSQPFFWEVLTPLKGELQLMIAELDPTEASMEMMEHGGQELVLVMEGEVEVKVANEVHDLQPGDAITFSARLPHGFRNRGSKKATMLNATAPPSIGERWH